MMRFHGQAALAIASAIVVAGTAQAMPARQYVMQAGAGDLFEKRSSEIVLQTTRDPAIRAFAAMMLTDHSRSTAMVKMAARRAGIAVPPPVMDGRQLRMIADLRRAHGPRRDRLYVDQQRMAHRQALRLHQDYATGGSVPPLRAAAARIVPVIEKHIDRLDRLRAR